MTTKSRTLKRTLADRVGELRLAKGYTMQRFADQFGAKLNTVRGWLHAQVLPRAEALRAIADHFGVTTDWLLGVQGAPKYRTQVRTDAALVGDVANHISREVTQQLRGGRASLLVFLEGRRYDGAIVLRQAVDLEVKHLQNAFRDWDRFDLAIREKTEIDMDAMTADDLTERAVAHLLAARGDAPRGSHECACGVWVRLAGALDHARTCAALRAATEAENV